MAEETKRTFTNRRQSPAARGGPAPAALTLRFPQIERVFDAGELDSILRKVEKTCRGLDAQTRSGDIREQERARAALTGYGRALELIRDLEQLRQSMTAPATNRAGRR